VFVCNKRYFDKFVRTCTQLITIGKYSGDICLVIGDDLKDDRLLDHSLIKTRGIIVQHFPEIVFPEEFVRINNAIECDGRNRTKKFQWHKMHLFNTFFKRWNYIFYIDCGMSFFADISPILAEATPNTLLAHSDAYPTFEWKLHVQFDKKSELFTRLNAAYNLNGDYFQSTIMLYDTAIIEDTTFDDLMALANEFPISRTNEQGIMALYFTNVKPVWKPIRIKNDYTYFYDFASRDRSNKYIMLKY
jgi:hypothetical protein